MNEIKLLQKQIDQIDILIKQGRWSSDFKAWQRKTASLLEKVFDINSRQLKDFEKIRYSLGVFTSSTPDSAFEKAFMDGLRDAKAILQSMVEELIEFNSEDETDGNSEISDNPYLFIIGLLNRFHVVARQLRSRHEHRQTLEVDDEYDVQDFLHALLKVKFDDIRREEWTPSYAGGAARMDIFIKDLGIVIEVKKTRVGLKDRKIGEELIIDIAKYRNHPGCSKLICFVYDPEGLVGNPAGLASDLSSEGEGFAVEVVVRP